MRFSFRLSLFGLLLGGAVAPAQFSYTWVGPTSDNWSNADAWLDRARPVAPGSGVSALTFLGWDDHAVTATNDLGGSAFALNSLTVNNFSTAAFRVGTAAGSGLSSQGANPAIVQAGPSDAVLQAGGNDIAFAPTSGTTSILGAGDGSLTIDATLSGLGGLTVNQTGLGVIRLNANNTFSGGVTLTGGNLLLGHANGLGAAGNSLGVGTGSLQAGVAGLTVANPVSVSSGGALTVTGRNDFTLSGGVGGAGGLTVGQTTDFSAAATVVNLTLTAANAYAGATRVTGNTATLANTGAELTLSGAGTLPNTASVTLARNGVLTLDNSGTNNTDRVRDAAGLTLSGGGLTFTPRAGAASGETFGNVTLNAGLSTFTLNAGGSSTALGFGALTPNFGGVIFARGPIGGAAASTTVQLTFAAGAVGLIDPAGSGTTQRAPVVPFVGGNRSATGGDFQTLVTSDGTAVLVLDHTSAADFNQATTFGGLSDFRNNTLGGSATDLVFNATRPVNSLVVDRTAALAVTGTGELQVYSGVVVLNSALTLTGPHLNFGNRGYVYLGDTLTVRGDSQLRGNDGLVVAANTPRTLVLGNEANPFTGGLSIGGQATVEFYNTAQLGGAGSGVRLAGGTLSYVGGTAGTVGRGITTTQAGGSVRVDAAFGDLTWSGPIGGSGFLTKRGGGLLILTGDNSGFTGELGLVGGTVRASDPMNLGAAQVNFLGGTLNLTATMTVTNPFDLSGMGGGTAVGGTLTVNGGATVTYTGILHGTHPLTVGGAGTFRPTVAQPYSGRITLDTTLSLRENGSLLNVPEFTVNFGGQLAVSNTAAVLPDRVSDQARVRLTGGDLRLFGNDSATVAETVGTLFAAAGSSTVTVDPGTNQSASLVLMRYATSGTSTVLFRGTNLGGGTGTRARVAISDVANTLLVQRVGAAGGFLPFAWADDTLGGFGKTFAFYDTSGAQAVGVRLATSSDYYNVTDSPGRVIQNAAPVNTPTTAVVRIANDWTTGTAAQSNTIAGLNLLPTQNVSTLTVSNTLTLSTGLVLVDPAEGNAVVTGGTLATGTAATPLRVHLPYPNVNSALRITSKISTGSGLFATGGGLLTVTGNQDLLTGPITVVGPSLTLNGDFPNLNPTGTTTLLTFNSGGHGIEFTFGTTLPAAGIDFHLLAGGGDLNGNSFTFRHLTVTGTLNSGETRTGGITTVTDLPGFNGHINLNTDAVLRVVGGSQAIGQSGGDIAGAGRVVYDPAAVSTFGFYDRYTFQGGVTGGTKARFDLRHFSNAAGTAGPFGSGPVTLLADTNSTRTVPLIGFAAGAANNGVGTLHNSIALPAGANLTHTISALGWSNQRITFSGLISGGSPTSTLAFDEDGDQFVPNSTLYQLTNADNSFQGTVRVNRGTVQITTDAALGNTANGVTLGPTAGPTGAVSTLRFANDLTLHPGRTITLMTADPSNVNVLNTSGVNADGSVGSGNTIAFGGRITGAGGFTKAGAGSLTLGGASDYAGATTVTAGRLTVNGSITSPVTVTGGTLAGTGTVGSATIRNGAFLRPGTSASPGTLTSASAAVLDPGATFVVRANGATAGLYDRLTVSAGSVTLTDAVLEVTVGGGWNGSGTATSGLVILDKASAGNITGRFAGLPTNGSQLVTADGLFTALISYNGTSAGALTGGNSVVLYQFTPVPEPTAVLAVCGVVCGAVAACSRRRRELASG
jgi:autotransporter-associated beta strand protein